MCGRFSQREQSDIYAALLNWTVAADDGDRYRYNVPPGTRPLTMHRLGDGEQHIERAYWGYEPSWSKMGPASNAKLEKLLVNSPWWRGTLVRRLVVPVDGWFEWTGDKPNKQPWYITAKDNQPILLAAVSGWTKGESSDADHGFAIVTDATAGALKEIHTRRPIALTPGDALEWLSPDLKKIEALELLSTSRPESAFRWWQVTRDMGNSKYQRNDAISPV